MSTSFKLSWKWGSYGPNSKPPKDAPWIKITVTASGATSEDVLINWQKANTPPVAVAGVTVSGAFYEANNGNLALTIDDKYKAGATFHKWMMEPAKATDAAGCDKAVADDPKAADKYESTTAGQSTTAIQMPDDNGKDVPFAINAPGILTFERKTGQTGASLDEATFRSTAVAYMEQVNGLGASGSDDRTNAYTDFLGLWRNDAEAPAWKQKTQGASSCGIAVRSLWRLLGLRAPGTISFDAPYASNQIFVSLQKIAESVNAYTKIDSTLQADGKTFLPQKGDVVFIATDTNEHEHVFTCTQDATDPSAAQFNLASIDGGQTHMTAQPWPPGKGMPGAASDALFLADEPCEGIWRRKRTFTRAGLKMNGTAQDGAKPSTDAGKVIVGWIQLGKMQSLFKYDLVAPVRKGLPEFQTT